jgi:hypothetical protein
MRREQEPFVLAISPSPRGFAFVLFQGADKPFDWGVKDVRGPDKNIRCMKAIGTLVDEYRPTTIAIEDVAIRTKRGFRIRSLLRSIEKLAERKEAGVQRISRKEVRAAFAAEGALTRPAIAEAIARRIPAFAHRLPPTRKIWQSEDPRQSLFDAAALAISFYGLTSHP